MKKVKIVLTLLITMSLFWIAPSASKSVNAEGVYCSEVNGLNDKSEKMRFRANPDETVVLTFSNGKKIEKTMPKEKNQYNGCSELIFQTPNDVKPLLVYGKPVKVEYKRGKTVVETKKLTVKRGIMDIKTMSYDKDTHVVSGTGHPGGNVELHTQTFDETFNPDNYNEGRNEREMRHKLKIDATGKWTYKYTDKESKKINELTRILAEPGYDYETEELFSLNWSGGRFWVGDGMVNPIVAGDKYIVGEVSSFISHTGGPSGTDWTDSVEVHVTFPNGQIVKHALKSGRTYGKWSVEIPKDIVLKPQDKVTVQYFSNWLDKGSLEPIIVTVGGETPKTPTVNYSAHVQNIGWQTPVKDGALAGTSGKGLRVESFRMNLTNLPMSGGIKYATHVQNIGWQNEVSNNQISGTTGKNLRMEAIKISLTGEVSKYYDVYYRTHIQNYGWLDWAKNGEPAGSEGRGLRMEAIEVKLVKKGSSRPAEGLAYLNFTYPEESVYYSAHVQNIGWQDSVGDGELSGTSGKGLRVEAFKMNVLSEKTNDSSLNSGISYATHIQNIGWQNPVSNGAISGTEGRGLRMEAIRVNLTGAVSKYYDVYYRTHVQNYGWLGWAKNGQNAGSEGKALRMEAIEVKLVAKGDPAPKTGASYVLANGKKV